VTFSKVLFRHSLVQDEKPTKTSLRAVRDLNDS